MKFSVELLPGVTALWECAVADGRTLDDIRQGFHDTAADLLRLAVTRPRVPPVLRAGRWEVARGDVVIAPEDGASGTGGYTVRVPVGRLIAVVSRITAVLDEVLHLVSLREAPPAAGATAELPQ